MALKNAIVCLLLAVVCNTFQEGEGLDHLQDDEFLEWVSQYHGDGDNLAQIYPTWRKNADFVRHQNTLGLSYTLSVNKFAHMNINDLVRGKNKIATPLESVSQDPAPLDIPSSVDWREKGVIPPVADQGQCGDPVLFAAVDSIDAIWAISSGQLILGSREECMDCCLKNSSCHGELYGLSIYECVVRLGGLAREDDYSSPNHTCLSDKFSPAVKISGAKYVTPSGDEKALAAAVARQPIVVAVDASHQSFQLYRSGVYYEPDCSSEGSKLDHTVLVVGYGSEDGQDYWIVKNSWGEAWGINGYILMARNKNNNCGIATEPMYPYYTALNM